MRLKRKFEENSKYRGAWYASTITFDATCQMIADQYKSIELNYDSSIKFQQLIKYENKPSFFDRFNSDSVRNLKKNLKLSNSAELFEFKERKQKAKNNLEIAKIKTKMTKIMLKKKLKHLKTISAGDVGDFDYPNFEMLLDRNVEFDNQGTFS